MTRDAKSFANRQADITSAAIEVFAEIGYYRATTSQIAKRVQISQPYVFHFFQSKEELLLSALEVSWSRIIASFREVVDSASSELLESELITAYEQVADSYHNEVLLQMQAQTMQEEAIQNAMRYGFGEVRKMLLEAFRQAKLPNPEERTMLFLARGMLCNIAKAIEMPELKEA
ncbi:TetR/AcrR family transcriptional regulator [Paenibacillus sp. PR3]|uniref:TetR/AcrR family transcriptional regulator n=1 Tax=Paenibacillus terricola TaxID=2763503 RepID=A0ABR8MR73_9BACL|nr:TetR/AcrR family transcriptional regulator [Paenibacillus terricola]MBD3917310.1 TetR/AcrR family transcriptional regulator [Paenibacillus terricola]